MTIENQPQSPPISGRKTTRRTFLRNAAIGAAPLILPRSLWAGNHTPSERVTMGLIGMGKMANGMTKQFLYSTQVLAVCDVDTTRRLHAKKTVDDFYKNNPKKGAPGCTAYSDFQDLLARDDIDAVYIATPDHWHTIITLAALRAGKDVYCEKPLTHNIAEAVAVMKEVDKQKRILQTGSMQRSSSEFRVACELVRNGLIGKLDRVECSFGNPGIPYNLPEEPIEPGLDWNFWIGPAPVKPYNSRVCPRGIKFDFWAHWRDYREFGGGGLADMGAHQLDITQWALDMDHSGPTSVIPPDQPNAKRGTQLVYDNGVRVIHKDGFMVHAFGSHGQVAVNRGQIWFSRNGKTIAKFTKPQDGGSLGSKLALIESDHLKNAPIRLRRPHNSHVGDFLASVKSRKKPITHEQIGARSAICCHLMNLAYFHHQKIQWDPKNCTFAKGSGDPAWLTRDYRDYRKAMA